MSVIRELYVKTNLELRKKKKKTIDNINNI